MTGAKVNISYLLVFSMVFVSLVSHYFGPFHIPDFLLCMGNSPKVRRSLLVAVASRAERVERRQTIRATWKKLSLNTDESELFFFTAEKPCPLDPYWRLRESACLPWSLFLPVNVDEKVSIRPYRLQPSTFDPGPAFDGIGFKLKFPVSIKQLGLSKRALAQWDQIHSGRKHNLTLEIFDPNAGEAQLAVNFSRTLLASFPTDDGFVYVNLGEETFARGFEGAIRIQPGSGLVLNQSLSCNLVWNKMMGDDGLIPLDSLWSQGHSYPFTFHSCPLVTLVYQIPDIQELRQMVNARDTQNKCQENRNRQMNNKVVEETEDFDDVVFLPEVVDVPENVPLALLGFLQWAWDKYDFEHLLITDDRSIVALDRVLQKVIHEDASGPTWRSQFRRDLPVKHFGLEPEANFRSSRYPATPSEAGSVLSKYLAYYLVKNAPDLSSFSTLSRSLAVWLSPLSPDYIEDLDFAADNATCVKKRTIARGPFYRHKTIKAIWEQYSHCSSLCSCS